MAEVAHIFLSYRSIEAEFALALAADLKNEGVSIWMDRLDGIQGGDDWRRSIQQAVNDCAALIAVLSPDYVTAEYCLNELARANDLGRPILPVLLRPVERTQWPIELQRAHYVDFREWHNTDTYRQKLTELLKIIRERCAAQLTPIPDTETRYLTSLIAQLESRKGVLAYVELAAQTETSGKNAEGTNRPDMRVADAWGLDSAFAMLGSGDEGRSGPSKPVKTSLSSIREALAEHTRFVLIGEPGAGKTTTIQRLALDAARQRLQDPRSAPLPFLAYLSAWQDEPTLAEFIRAQWRAAGLPDSDPLQQMTTSGVLVYLDGLNEMGAAGQDRARQLRDWIESRQGPHNLIVTCRAADYAVDLDLRLPVVVAEEMDTTRIRQFADGYLGENAAQKFLDQVLPGESIIEREDSRHLSRLARNPFLLTALMVIYRNSPGSKLPANMGTLFQRLATVLWERERLRQTPGWVRFAEIEFALSHLAFNMINQSTPTAVPIPTALDSIRDMQLLDVVRSASLLEVQGQEVRFYHQLMLEYFAAVALGHESLSSRLGEPNVLYFMGRVAGKWDQPAIALCGISPDPDAVVFEIAAKDVFLAAQCAASGVKISDGTWKDLVNHLLAELHDTNAGARRAAVVALKALGDKSAIPDLLATLQDNDVGVGQAASEALVQIGPAALPGLLEAAKHPNTNGRRAAVEALADIADGNTVPDLLTALRDDDSFVRSAAARGLGQIRASRAAVDLAERLVDDENRWVRRACAEALAAIGNNIAIQGLFVALLVSDSPDTRSAILNGIRRLGSAAVPVVADGLNSEVEAEQENAVAALAFINTPESLAVLKQWRQERSARD